MNNSYSSLRALATIFKVLGWTNIVAAILFVIVVFIPKGLSMPSGNITLLFIIVVPLIFAVICFASAQFILLFVDIANRVETIDNNIYVIASKVEKEN